MRLRWIITVVLATLFSGLALIAIMEAHHADPAKLAKRCAESHPSWAGYQEDIKEQVGAQPVAAWRGRLEQVRQEAGLITVTFRLESPWAGYDADVPVLLRDPMGRECRQESVERQGGTRRYIFLLNTESGTSILPWVEIHFPHTERRIALGTEGLWKESPPMP
jgi:hypothetical protein